MLALIAAALELLGATCVVAGAWLLAPWLGLVVLGVLLTAAAFALDRSTS